MDFKRTEILNPLLSVAPLFAVDANDPYYDTDNDLIFSQNGALINLDKPIEDYNWVDFLIENASTIFPSITVSGLTNGVGTPLAATFAVAILSNSGRTTFRLPDIGRIEQLKFTCSNGAFLAVKNITVVNKSAFYKKISNLVNVVPTMAGWTYDAVNNRYSRIFTALEDVTFQVNATLASINDYVHVKVWTNSSQIIQVNSKLRNLVDNGFIANVFSAEWDISGNPFENSFPNDIQVIGSVGGGTVFVEFRYGKFPTHSASVFGSETLSLPTLSS